MHFSNWLFSTDSDLEKGIFLEIVKSHNLMFLSVFIDEKLHGFKNLNPIDLHILFLLIPYIIIFFAKNFKRKLSNCKLYL